MLEKIFILVLAVLLGIELIAKVPAKLHTPLMSGTNAISGITLVGAILAIHGHVHSRLGLVLAVTAVVLATVNVVGGYWVTDRMLRLFQHKKVSK